MRLAPTLFAAALAAVVVAHEYQGEKHSGKNGNERKGHPVGQFGGEHDQGRFKEASWWEKFQGKQPAAHEHHEHDHGKFHHARDAEAKAPDEMHHGHHGKHHHGHHGHKGAHKHEHHHKGNKDQKPWDKWGWFSGSDPEILPRDDTPEIVYPYSEDSHGHHKGEHHKDGHGHAPGHFGEHPHDEHAYFNDRANPHKPPALPHFERDTEEVGPDNEFFDATTFDDDFDDDDDDEEEPGRLSARDVEEEADPNEVSGDEDYYNLGDDGDDDIMDGEIGDAQDVDDDEDMDEDDLDDEDDDDEDDDDEADAGDEDDDDDDSEGLATRDVPEKMRKWAEVKRHSKHHRKQPKPKAKGWGIFPW